MQNDIVLAELANGSGRSIIGLVDGLLLKGRDLGASDIHIDPAVSDIHVRMRVDGVLQDVYILPKEIQPEIVSRIKVLADLRSDEHQMTQDGRFHHQLGEGEEPLDIRVSIAPTYRGENVVMRLLGETETPFTLASLGFSPEDQEKLLAVIKEPSGMILATGPTGSGKTTSLHTLLRMLNTKDVSIITLEDPIEYAVDGVEQIQVNQAVGLTFANGLRSILRQDPNIIMVGEIRDTETASIAINTALTGHLLLSTLHTNDAATTLPRLLDMKIEPFLLASTMRLAIGQRLVRKNCAACKEEVKVDKTIAKSLEGLTLREPVEVGEKFWRGTGCAKCNNSGYSGRVSINEVLVADDQVRDAILRRASSAELKDIAVKNGMTTMLDDGFVKIRAGETTVEEILRVIHD